jgi:hypothetical protein
MKRVIVGAMLLASLGTGCRYNNVFSQGKFSHAPYTGLRCFEPDNDEGFSFEIPGCACEQGIRLRYLAKRMPDRSISIRYVYESGYLTGDPNNFKTAISRSTKDIDEITVGGRKLLPYAKCSDGDRQLWDLMRESYVKIWENYETVIPELRKTCLEDEVARNIGR